MYKEIQKEINEIKFLFYTLKSNQAEFEKSQHKGNKNWREENIVKRTG